MRRHERSTKFIKGTAKGSVHALEYVILSVTVITLNINMRGLTPYGYSEQAQRAEGHLGHKVPLGAHGGQVLFSWARAVRFKFNS